MEFKKYQEEAEKTALYPDIGAGHVYPALGLAGEVGELLNKVKKIHRDKDGEVDDETRDFVEGELGDVLWYVSEVARKFDLDLDDIAERNIDKLHGRKERGKIHGDGDNR